jgi:hypothetical protein
LSAADRRNVHNAALKNLLVTFSTVSAAMISSVSAVLIMECHLGSEYMVPVMGWIAAEGLDRSLPPAEFTARLESFPHAMQDVHREVAPIR